MELFASFFSLKIPSCFSGHYTFTPQSDNYKGHHWDNRLPPKKKINKVCKLDNSTASMLSS